MRKSLPVVSIIILMVLFCSPGTQAQEFSSVDTMSVPIIEGMPGDTLFMPVDLVNTFDVAGFQLRIVHDTSAFLPLNVVTTDRSINFESFGANLLEPGVIGFFASSLHPRSNAIPPGRGEVAMISILIKDNALPGSYEFLFIDEDNNSFDNALSDTSSTLVIPILGDGYVIVGSQTGAEESSIVPTEFVLGQNYPNPFNGETIIPFTTTRAGRVEIDIFDILGKKVASLYSGYLEPGERRLIWHGKSLDGNDLSSGVFLYHLRTSWGESVTKRMTLLK